MGAGAIRMAGWAVALCLASAPAMAQTPPAEPGKATAEPAPAPGLAPSPTRPVEVEPKPAAPGTMSQAEIRELIEASQATAKATREAVDYARVTPDLLTQILAKLDKLEDKLDKVENAIKGTAQTRRR